MSVFDGPLLGTAYYPEYMPEGHRDVERDLDLMVAAGIRVIRVGESVWSTWEPREGLFDLEWLTPVLDAAHARGIAVILGTPTYAIPPWLQLKHPELAVELADGRHARWGARQEVDFTNPVFLSSAERVIRAVLERHGRHPAVVAVQLDNEPGLHLIHNPATVDRFRVSLKEQYGTTDALNEAWGLTYWSHRIGSWDELWAPGGNSTPAYDLAWRRFQARCTTEFIAWQADIARAYIDEGTQLTTCIAYNRAAVDDVALGGVLDVVSGNAYLDMQDALDRHSPSRFGQSVWFTTSPAALFQQADRMRSSQQGSFLVTETGATTIAGSHQNRPPFPGQLRQVALALVARGARLVSYWHWHTLHSGAETYWGGILGHDLQPGRVYDEIASIGASLTPDLNGLVPDTDIGLLFSRDSRWLMQFHPPLAVGASGDKASYDRILGRFAEAASLAGLQCGYVSTEQLPSAEELLEQYPVFVVAGAIALSDEASSTLTRYAELGGRLVLGIRSGYGDEIGRARVATAPGLFREAAGVRYREYSNVGTVSVQDGTAEAWIDHLELEGADALLGYADERFAAWPAATSHAHGLGSVVTVGTLPDPRSLAHLLGGTRLTASLVRDLPDTVTAHTATNAAGDRVLFLHNWSATSVDTVVTGYGQISLGAWDVRIVTFKETP